jgi:arginyl-tRNA--protein-N-Asp/Glu arginylyltransferase
MAAIGGHKLLAAISILCLVCIVTAFVVMRRNYALVIAKYHEGALQIHAEQMRDKEAKERAQAELESTRAALAEAQRHLLVYRLTDQNKARVDPERLKPLSNFDWQATSALSSLDYELCRHTLGREVRITLDKKKLKPSAAKTLLEDGYQTSMGTFVAKLCRDCTLCQPVRIDTQVPFSRRQRRAVSAAGLSSRVNCSPLIYDNAHAAVVQQYADARYDVSGISIMELMSSKLGMPFLIDFYDKENILRGFVLASRYESVAEAHLHFFDPNWSRSTGTAIITEFLEICRDSDIAYVYLGDTMHGQLGYKKTLAGAEYLTNGGWLPVIERKISANHEEQAGAKK